MSELTDDRLRKIVAGCEGVTPGPWAVNPVIAQVDAFDDIDGFSSADPVPVCQMLWPTLLRSEDETEANASHIARLDPDTVKAICTELLARRAAASTSTEGAGVKALEWRVELMDPAPSAVVWWCAACPMTNLGYEVRVTNRGKTRTRMVGQDWSDFTAPWTKPKLPPKPITRLASAPASIPLPPR